MRSSAQKNLIHHPEAQIDKTITVRLIRGSTRKKIGFQAMQQNRTKGHFLNFIL